MKARGIATDLCGTEQGYVLPVQELQRREQLTGAFDALYSRRDELKNHLQSFLPGYLAAGQQEAERFVRCVMK